MDYEIKKNGGDWEILSLDQLSKKRFEHHLAKAKDCKIFPYHVQLSGIKGVICLDVKKELCQVGQDIVYSATDVFKASNVYYIKPC